MSAGTLPRGALSEGALGDSPPEVTPSIATVYTANFSYVWRCLRSLGVPDAVLDDALQDVFLVVQKRLAQFDGRAELRTWLYAIALRVARRYRSSAFKGRASEVSNEDALPTDAGTDLHAQLECSERLGLARRALDALDADKREVFVLAQVEQLSAPEIAQIIGIPLNTVYSRLRAARQAFAAEVLRLERRPRISS